MSKFKKYLWFGIVLLTVSFFYFSSKGYFNLTMGEIFAGVLGRGAGSKYEVVKEIRFPRMIVAAMTGMVLSVSGVVFQGVLFNPLADSFILGIASGAAFGASVAIVTGFALFGMFSITVTSFVFAILALYMVIAMSQKNGILNSGSLILSGVIISSFFSAGVSFLQFLKGEGVQKIIFWIMGSFASKSWSDAAVITVIGSVLMSVIYRYSRELNLISLGDRVAISSGVDVKKIKKKLLLCGALLAATAVSISGIIGFVGLMVPHFVRSLVGSDNRKVIPLSMVYGGVLTMVSDSLLRVYITSEIPIGVVMAILGTPFFMVIFRKKIMGSV